MGSSRPDRCEIVRNIAVRMEDGRWKAEPRVTDTVSCRFEEPGASEMASHLQHVGRRPASIVFPSGTFIDDEDVLRITTRGGEEWTVEEVLPQGEVLVSREQ